MTLEQITLCVDNGQIVHWSTAYYTVIKDRKNQYLIKCDNGSCIGLTWRDGVTLNGREDQFYIAYLSRFAQIWSIDPMRTIETTLYHYNELTPEAQERAKREQEKQIALSIEAEQIYARYLRSIGTPEHAQRYGSTNDL